MSVLLPSSTLPQLKMRKSGVLFSAIKTVPACIYSMTQNYAFNKKSFPNAQGIAAEIPQKNASGVF
jgi:hypothetical protein